jgi:hypothetical protein
MCETVGLIPSTANKTKKGLKQNRFAEKAWVYLIMDFGMDLREHDKEVLEAAEGESTSSFPSSGPE